MTVASPIAARDEMFKLFNDAWTAGTFAIVGYVPEVRYQGREKGKPDNSKFWCRVSTQTILDRQATLSDCVGEPFKKRFETSGLLFGQIFAPKAVVNSYELGYRLAILARGVYRGKTSNPGGIVFQNVRINELPPEELSWRFNVVAEFEFDEIG
jgi:hypothetical protein